MFVTIKRQGFIGFELKVRRVLQVLSFFFFNIHFSNMKSFKNNTELIINPALIEHLPVTKLYSLYYRL